MEDIDFRRTSAIVHVVIFFNVAYILASKKKIFRLNHLNLKKLNIIFLSIEINF